MRTEWKAAAAGTVTAVAALLAYDLYKNLSIAPLPDLPADDKRDPYPDRCSRLLMYLEFPEIREADGIELNSDWIREGILSAKQVIDARWDCQDFRWPTLLRLVYSHSEALERLCPDGIELIKAAFLGAKFWMTEPGSDSMCYWSENHQILYAVGEYLAGQLWPKEVFSNAGITGKEHMRRGLERINYWMEQRFRYGYSEFNSSNYYLFNVGPAANFIEFAAAEHAAAAERMKICLDLLLFDIASNMQDFTFTAPTGRAYVDNMVGGGSVPPACAVPPPPAEGKSLSAPEAAAVKLGTAAGGDGDRCRKLTDFLWGLNEYWKASSHSMLTSFICMCTHGFYTLPEAIRAVGLDKRETVQCVSHGLTTAELEEQGWVGQSDKQIMRQWSMEAFTNPEVIYNTVQYLKAHRMFPNKFINQFKFTALKLLDHPHVMRLISSKLNPMPNGIAIQRANLYTLRTPGAAMYNVQNWNPGGYGAQPMLSLINFGGNAVVFTTHPARGESEKSVRAYPGYWAGFGRAPQAVQDGRVLLQIHHIPKRPGFLELYPVPQFTHTYLPEAFFDEVIVHDRYAFVRKGEAFAAVIGFQPLRYLPWSESSAKAFRNGLELCPEKRFDLVQYGNEQYTIYELSDSTRESFAAFQARIQANPAAFDGATLNYVSGGKLYVTAFGGDFYINAEKVNLRYPRFAGAYCNAERDAQVYTIACGGHTLRLDYAKAERVLDV
ncbi:MAG: hypothetical protein LBR73_00920 [Oscillospiraceae bacterium]|jgi:hypothetical protein|nr:hypothetical protein [Oscillospiraceae bacterium]